MTTNPANRYVVEDDVTKSSANGKERRRFRKGNVISMADAARFGFLDAANAGMARPGDEKPDVAPDDTPAGRDRTNADEQTANATDAPDTTARRSGRRGPTETTEASGPNETS